MLGFVTDGIVTFQGGVKIKLFNKNNITFMDGNHKCEKYGKYGAD